MIDIIDRFHIPPGGWYVRIGMYDVRGDTYNELAKNVTDHVRNNSMEISDVHNFIQKQIYERAPSLRISR